MAEAASAGTVVLASDCPFSHEILDGYENAYFFDPFKPSELADLMRKVIKGEIVKKDCAATFTGSSANGATSAVGSAGGWARIIDFILNFQQ